MSMNIKIGITAIVCLAIGYFGGREYLKYEIRSTMRDAVTQMQSSIAGVTGSNKPDSAPVSAPATQQTEQEPLTVVLEKRGSSLRTFTTATSRMTLPLHYNSRIRRKITSARLMG